MGSEEPSEQEVGERKVGGDTAKRAKATEELLLFSLFSLVNACLLACCGM